MKITKEWLKEKSACGSGMAWFEGEVKEISEFDLLDKLIKTDEKEKLQWANWLLSKLFNRKQKIHYTIFAAEQVVDIFEKKYPNDKRPRKAIEAARAVLENDTTENRIAAYTAAVAVAAATAAAYTAADYTAAATAAAYNAAAYAAVDAADDAYNAYVYGAVDAAATTAAAYAAVDYKKMLVIILNYGIELLKKEPL